MGQRAGGGGGLKLGSVGLPETNSFFFADAKVKQKRLHTTKKTMLIYVYICVVVTKSRFETQLCI